jgi:hypothetical protein
MDTLAVSCKLGKQATCPKGGISCPASKTGDHIFNINLSGEFESEII